MVRAHMGSSSKEPQPLTVIAIAAVRVTIDVRTTLNLKRLAEIESITGDGKQPKCSRCDHAKKECIYETGRRFRRSSIQESFSDSQPWVSLPPRSRHHSARLVKLLTSVAVQFLDESSEVRSQYTDDSSYPFSSPPVGFNNSPKPDSSKSGRSPSDIPSPSFTIVTPTDGFTVLSLLNSDSPSQPTSHHTPSISQDDHARLETFPRTESSTFVYEQAPGQPILWPLEHEQEAMLLQHYIENVALFVSSTSIFFLSYTCLCSIV